MPVMGPSVLPGYFGGKPADAITQALLQRQEFDRQRDIDAVNTGIGLSNVDDSSQNPATQPGVVDRIKQAYQRVTGQGVQATPAQQAGTRTELNQMATRQAGANTGALNAAVYGSNGNGGAPNGTWSENPSGPSSRPAWSENGTTAGTYASNGVQPAMRLPSGGVVQTAWTPYGQKMAEAKLTHDYMLAALGIRGDQRMNQIGAQGDNQVNTAGIRGGFQVATTGMRTDQSNTNNLRSTSQSNTNNLRSTDQSNVNNLRTTSTSASNNANTVGAGLTKHNTVSADALVSAASRGGLNQTVMQSRSHLPEATGADQLLDQLGPTLAKRGGNGLLSNGILGQVDPRAQRANQAGEQFVTLVGPMLNHGRMTQQDLDQVRKTYIPQVGDTPDVIQQKSTARKSALTAIQAQAKLGTVPTSLSSPGAATTTAPSPHSTLTPAQQARAATDPAYAAFLKTKGQM